MSDKKLIVGLGNPGAAYADTRHNAGFLVVQYFAQQHHVVFKRSRHCRGLVASLKIGGDLCQLLLPWIFMNNSGQAVKALVDHDNIAFKDILVVCDDFSLDFGQIRLRLKGSAGGHNGLSSIIFSLGADTFARLRMGIGKPPAGRDPADFVLDKFSRSEKKELTSLVKNGSECCLLWVSHQHQRAMDQFNKRKRENG